MTLRPAVGNLRRETALAAVNLVASQRLAPPPPPPPPPLTRARRCGPGGVRRVVLGGAAPFFAGGGSALYGQRRGSRLAHHLIERRGLISWDVTLRTPMGTRSCGWRHRRAEQTVRLPLAHPARQREGAMVGSWSKARCRPTPWWPAYRSVSCAVTSNGEHEVNL
ncbi:hypothetical protein [Candidatus Amarolinea dominans]|uniref:hypothetical protein n=1 Tax=Candidatus Amarolinea dominans TaxID=3140696 RepID=UPI003134D011|nr:hypothetical protein [Anaerolineae bacterium]